MKGYCLVSASNTWQDGSAHLDCELWLSISAVTRPHRRLCHILTRSFLHCEKKSDAKVYPWHSPPVRHEWFRLWKCARHSILMWQNDQNLGAQIHKANVEAGSVCQPTMPCGGLRNI